MKERNAQIGIRREDKSRWERRAPLTPTDVRWLRERHGIQAVIQPSEIRVFPDSAYREAGAAVDEDLSTCPVILAVKEIPVDLLQPDTTYMFFSHTIKGQKQNMPMLRRMMELRCDLIDYERVVDGQNRRLIFFGRFAGLAGMTDTLWALGQRFKKLGIANPFETIAPAHSYNAINDIKNAVAQVGRIISRDGLPQVITPLVIGFAGYGNVSQGAQEIVEPLPRTQVTPQALAGQGTPPLNDPKTIYTVVFKEEDIVEPRDADATFILQDYYDHPEKYQSQFDRYLPHLSVLVNCIYWDKRYPRLVTKAELQQLFSDRDQPRLTVIGDISCDIEGSIAATVKCTPPDNPVYVYDPHAGAAVDGFVGHGPVILAVDILPSELPRDATENFSLVLREFIPALTQADFTIPLVETTLPAPLTAALILQRGKLTPEYEYIQQYLD